MASRLLVLSAAIAGVLGGAVVGGSALVGASAGTSPSTPDRSTSAAHPRGDRPCGPAWDRLPAALKADLKAAHELPAGPERQAALAQIRKDALAGKYGADVQKFAQKRAEKRAEKRPEMLGRKGGADRGEHRGNLREQMPAALRADLEAVRDLPAGDRMAAMQQIRKDALAGKYGADVQKFAQKRAEKRAEKRPEMLGHKGGADRGEHRGNLREQMPAALRADLEAVRDLPAGDRMAAMQQIRKDALAGKYGEKVQKFAQKRAEMGAGHRQDRRDRCGPSTTES